MKLFLRAFLMILTVVVIAGINFAPVQHAFASGSIFQVVPSPNGSKKPVSNNLLLGVASITPSDMWAVGYFNGKTLAEHWDGKTWSVVASPNMDPQQDNPNTLFAATAVGPGNVMTVGTWDSFQKGNPGERTLTLLTTQG